MICRIVLNSRYKLHVDDQKRSAAMQHICWTLNDAMQHNEAKPEGGFCYVDVSCRLERVRRGGAAYAGDGH
jgi:hypothetical protein